MRICRRLRDSSQPVAFRLLNSPLRFASIALNTDHKLRVLLPNESTRWISKFQNSKLPGLELLDLSNGNH